MSDFGIFRIKFEKNIVIFDITTFESVKIKSFMLNNKELELGPKLPCLGIFGQEFEKKYCHIWNQHPLNYQNELLTNIVNFSIESTFSKGPESTFSEGLDPDPIL